MERRNFIRLSVMGAGAMGATQLVLAQPAAAESLSAIKNIYFYPGVTWTMERQRSHAFTRDNGNG